MCEHCQAHDDEDDLDALAAAFVARRQGVPVKPASSQAHALTYRQKPAAPAPRAKEHPNA